MPLLTTAILPRLSSNAPGQRASTVDSATAAAAGQPAGLSAACHSAWPLRCLVACAGGMASSRRRPSGFRSADREAGRLCGFRCDQIMAVRHTGLVRRPGANSAATIAADDGAAAQRGRSPSGPLAAAALASSCAAGHSPAKLIGVGPWLPADPRPSRRTALGGGPDGAATAHRPVGAGGARTGPPSRAGRESLSPNSSTPRVCLPQEDDLEGTALYTALGLTPSARSEDIKKARGRRSRPRASGREPASYPPMLPPGPAGLPPAGPPAPPRQGRRPGGLWAAAGRV